MIASLIVLALGVAYLAGLIAGIIRSSIRAFVVAGAAAAVGIAVSVAAGSAWWGVLCWVFNLAMVLLNAYLVRRTLAAREELRSLID